MDGPRGPLRGPGSKGSEGSACLWQAGSKGGGIALWAMSIKSALRDLAFCVIWHDKHSGDWLTAFATPPIRLCHWTRLRREGSEGSEDSEGSKGSKGGSGALRAQIIKKPAHAPRHFDRSEAEWRNLTPPWYMKHGDRRSLDSEHHGSASCLSPIAACGSARDDGGSG